jgi:hypothetical protein
MKTYLQAVVWGGWGRVDYIDLAESKYKWWDLVNPLNAELNLICHLLALLGAHPILHVSRIRVNM